MTDVLMKVRGQMIYLVRGSTTNPLVIKMATLMADDIVAQASQEQMEWIYNPKLDIELAAVVCLHQHVVATDLSWEKNVENLGLWKRLVQAPVIARHRQALDELDQIASELLALKGDEYETKSVC